MIQWEMYFSVNSAGALVSSHNVEWNVKHIINVMF